MLLALTIGIVQGTASLAQRWCVQCLHALGHSFSEAQMDQQRDLTVSYTKTSQAVKDRPRRLCLQYARVQQGIKALFMIPDN